MAGAAPAPALLPLPAAALGLLVPLPPAPGSQAGGNARRVTHPALDPAPGPGAGPADIAGVTAKNESGTRKTVTGRNIIVAAARVQDHGLVIAGTKGGVTSDEGMLD